ncbi:MAG: hypothetical protein QOC62_247 [Mycobacterium sp.]|jgi:NAD(P)-dependent dehydrogenase (short-subunit alcohol dehydrogenase family)|nr:hypothetical protein [Mycobacterium sp.]
MGSSAQKNRVSVSCCQALLGQRIGTPDDVADAVLFAMTNSFLTGVTLKVDGGEPLT